MKNSRATTKSATERRAPMTKEEKREKFLTNAAKYLATRRAEMERRRRFIFKFFESLGDSERPFATLDAAAFFFKTSPQVLRADLRELDNRDARFAEWTSFFRSWKTQKEGKKEKKSRRAVFKLDSDNMVFHAIPKECFEEIRKAREEAFDRADFLYAKKRADEEREDVQATVARAFPATDDDVFDLDDVYLNWEMERDAIRAKYGKDSV